MIATAALAGWSLTEADLSCSGYCKATGDVLDDGGDHNARGRLQKRAFRRSERALAAQGRWHCLIRCARNEKFYRLNSRVRPASAAANLLVGMKFVVQI